MVYLLYFLTAFVAPLLTNELVVTGDAATTANNILTHEALYRAGFAFGFIANGIYIAVTVLFYELFERVNRRVSLLAAFFSLVGCTIQIFGGLFQLAPLLLLKDPQIAHLFSTEILQDASMLSLAIRAQTFSISLVMFAVYDLLLGYLILASTFLPRALGILMAAAGAGWLTFLWPPLATFLSILVLPLGAAAELALMFWLVVKGAAASDSFDAA